MAERRAGSPGTGHPGCYLGLALSVQVGLYLCLFYVRTQQAWAQSGTRVDSDPVAALLRSVTLPLGADGLRRLSYAIFALIAVTYLWVIRPASRAGMRVVEERPGRLFLLWVVLPYCVLGLTSLLFYPHVSTPLDTVDYTVQARIQAIHGANPYLVPGAAFRGDDPLVPYMEARLRPSVYGPVWQYVAMLPMALGGGHLLASIVAYKVLFWVAGLACLGLLWAFQRRYGAGQASLFAAGAFVAWNPLLPLISHGEGHNDVGMALFLGAVVLALAARQSLPAYAAWTLSVLVKFLSAPLLVPLVACLHASPQPVRWSRTLRAATGGLLLGGGLALVAVAPFGIAPVLGNLTGRYGGLVSAAGDSKFALAGAAGARALGLLGVPVAGSALAGALGWLLPLGWLLYVALRGRGARDAGGFAKVAVESFLVYVTFVAVPVYAQYAVVPVVLAGFLPSGTGQRVAVGAVSLALGWDSLFLVYPPAGGYPAWELGAHQLSHLALLGVVGIYLGGRFLLARIGGGIPGRRRQAMGVIMRTARALGAKSVLRPPRAAGRQVLLDVADNPQIKLLRQLFITFEAARYTVLLRAGVRRQTLSVARVLSWHSNVRLLWGPVGASSAALFCSDRKRLGHGTRTMNTQYGTKVIHLCYDYGPHLRLPPAHFALPYFMHPQHYVEYHAPEHLAEWRALPRKVRVLFAGDCNASGYNRASMGEWFGKLTRYETLAALRGDDGVRVVDSVADLDALLAGPYWNGLLLIDSARLRIEQGSWLRLVAQADFFLCPPGVLFPLCHNAVEAMAVGTIPWTNYSDWFVPHLTAGATCLSYSSPAGLREGLREIRQMSDRQIAALRQGVHDYYREHLALAGFVARLAGDPARDVYLHVLDESEIPLRRAMRLAPAEAEGALCP